MVLLDRVNLNLIELLQKHGRISLSEMARQVRRAETTVRERLAALEAAGLVRGYRAIINAEKLGYAVRAYIHTDVAITNLHQLGEKLAAIPQVLGATLTSGPRPLIIELAAKDMNHLARIIEQRFASLGLRSTEIHVALKQIVESRPAPLPVPTLLGNPEPALETVAAIDETLSSPRPLVSR